MRDFGLASFNEFAFFGSEMDAVCENCLGGEEAGLIVDVGVRGGIGKEVFDELDFLQIFGDVGLDGYAGVFV